MSDDILLKSISNKRWVKKIFEYADPWYDITKINDTAKQLLLSYKEFSDNVASNSFVFKLENNNLIVFVIQSGGTYKLNTNLDYKCSDYECLKLFTDNYFNKISEFYSDFNLNNSFSKEKIFTNDVKMEDKEYNKLYDKSNTYILHGNPYIKYTLNLNTGEYDYEYNFIYAINKNTMFPKISDMLLYLQKNNKCKPGGKWIIFDKIIYPQLYHIQPNLDTIISKNSLTTMMRTFSFERLYKRLYNREYINSKKDLIKSSNDTLNQAKSQTIKQIEVQTDANLDKDYEYQSTTNGKKEKVKHQKSLQKYTVEIDNSPTEKDEVTMHIKSTSKDKNKALPYLYTSEVVTDERARTYMDVCNMVENNTTKIEDNLLSSSYGKILKYSKSNLGNITNIESNGKRNISKEEKEKLDKEELVYSAASFENKEQIRNISIRVCDCYLRAMADAKNKIFNKKYEGSKGLNYNLHLYLIEILSPLVIAACAENCKWTANTEDEGLKAFKDHVGVDESVSDFTTNCYISFPEASNFPLADSVIYINGIRTFISTKGGANGEGAHPAIKTLKEFVYGEDGKTLTYLTEVAKNEYPTEFAVFEELLQGNVSKINFNKIYNLTSCSSLFELKKWIDSKEDIFTKIIMTILQAQSFQFMQVNADSSSFNSDFHFNYRVQYPAVFSGNVSIDFEKNYIKFYIHKT